MKINLKNLTQAAQSQSNAPTDNESCDTAKKLCDIGFKLYLKVEDSDETKEKTTPGYKSQLYVNALNAINRAMEVIGKLKVSTTGYRNTLEAVLTVESLIKESQLKNAELENSVHSKAFRDELEVITSQKLQSINAPSIEEISIQFNNLESLFEKSQETHQKYRSALEELHETYTYRLNSNTTKDIAKKLKGYVSGKEGARSLIPIISVIKENETMNLASFCLQQIPLDASISDLKTHLDSWEAQFDEQYRVVLGTFVRLFQPLKEDCALTIEAKITVSEDLNFQCEKMAREAKEMAGINTKDNRLEKHRQQYRRLSAALTELQAIAKSELNHLKKMRSAETQWLNLPPSTFKTTSKKSKNKSLIESEQDLESPIIKTKYNGVLIGQRIGDHFHVNNHKGEVEIYHQIGVDWIKLRKDDAELDVAAENIVIELEENTDSQKIFQKMSRQINKIEESVDQSRNELIDAAKLSNFCERNGMYSQSLGIYFCARDKHERAMQLVQKIATKMDSKDSPDDVFADKLAAFQDQLVSMGNEAAAVKTERLNAVKDNPTIDEACLKFLLAEEEIEFMEQEQPRKRIKDNYLNLPDFLDVYTIRIKDRKNPLSLHIHYGGETARLKSKTASHLKYEIESENQKIEVRNKISLKTMENLFERFNLIEN